MSIQGDVDISGRIASIVEGGATIVVKRLAADLAECLAARSAGDAIRG